MSQLGDAAWDYLPTYVTASDDGTAAALLDALGAPVEGLSAVLTDPDVTADEWATPFPRIPWLAAIAGIDLSTVPDADQRAVVGDEAWRYRGTLATIRLRVGVTLTGAQSVIIVCPYSGDENKIAITTYASETPDAAATIAAILAEIPAWMEATIVTDAAGQSYDDLADDYADYTTMTATAKTYGTLSQET